MVTISASVGQNGRNKQPDVLAIQHALNGIPPAKGGPLPPLKEDGIAGPKTIGAIVKFQRANSGLIVDGRVDAAGPTLACINSLAGGKPPKPGPPPKPAPKFTDQNLYIGGKPAARDIKQDVFGDCYFVATLAAVAFEDPAMIQSAIYYDAKSEQFRVRLYETNGARKYIWVTQAELHDNVRRQGGSYVDNNGKYERIWPCVIETAYAKMHDKNPADGLGQGYKAIISGGWPWDGMMAITGNKGNTIKYKQYPKLGANGSLEVLGARVAAALNSHKSVTLWSVPERDPRNFVEKLFGVKIPQDGLVDNHVYTVLAITRNGTDWTVKVRNPWGTNMGVGEGQDKASAYMTVSLRKLVTTGGLESFQTSK
ncbi:MAG: hypothetical protein H6509_14720 [Bryobacterales bacterium]|nr:hypothetical protein [Bryobacterales bacterium]